MFSSKQELEFNIAFLQEMVQSTKGDLKQWQDINDDYVNNVEKMTKNWNNPDWKPSHVVTMMAWTRKAIELLNNRLQQNELKLKELDSERLPAEWAVLRFQQSKIMGQMNEIQRAKTGMLCHDLRDKLLGTQDDFQVSFGRLAKQAGSKKKSAPSKTKKVCVLVKN